MDGIAARRFGNYDNSLGFLRLVFALLVIVSHTPEIFDGNRDREILTRIFGTLSFGEVAVDGFFIISGYLIVSSFNSTRDPIYFLIKRIARIYPGFLVAFLFVIFIVAPIGGAALPLAASGIGSLVAQVVFLQVPDIGNVFNGTPYPDLNGSAWTIAYEFRCYLLVIILGMFGLFEKRWIVLALTLGSLASSALLLNEYHPYPAAAQPHVIPNILAIKTWFGITVGNYRQTIRLTSLFLAGGCFYLFAEALIFTRLSVVFALAGLCVGLCFPRSANPTIAVFGGYLIFAIGNLGAPHITAAINNRNDISYGVYLYAWPMTKIIQWSMPDIPLVFAFALVSTSSAILGFLSWRLIEKPVLSLVRDKKRLKARAGAA